MARVFISYRSSDGADKAAALERDLDERFGGDQIFLDKKDLAAGTHWRDAIAEAIDACPIVIVLVTPNFLGARDAEGGLSIARADDPMRAELEAGLAAKATVMPLLCDGVAHPPSPDTLPPPFDQLFERHCGRLRSFDWRADFGKLAEDLEQLGVVPRPEAAGDRPPPTAAAGTGLLHRRGVAFALGGVTALALAGAGVAAWHWRGDSEVLTGPWRARVGRRGATDARDGDTLMVAIEQQGQELTLVSHALDIARLAEWSEYRAFWRERFGVDLDRVYYRGKGTVQSDTEVASASSPPVAVRRIALAMSIYPPGGVEPIRGGTLEGIVDASERRIHARLWLNGEDSERVVDLRRGER